MEARLSPGKVMLMPEYASLVQPVGRGDNYGAVLSKLYRHYVVQITINQIKDGRSLIYGH